MAAFPDTIPPQSPHRFSDAFLTLTCGPYDSLRSVRDKARDVPGYRAFPNFAKKTWAEWQLLYAFFFDVAAGAFGAFTWFDFNGYRTGGVQWPYLHVCVRDGSTTAYDLPYKAGATGYAFKSAGSPIASPTITPTGTDGRDEGVFPDGGVEGDIVVAAATGRRAVSAHLEVDELSWEAFTTSLRTGLVISEIRIDEA